MTDTLTSVRLVVIGSGPAGFAAVQAFREHDATVPVVMVSADPHPPYARPPLTKDYLRGETERADLWLTDGNWFDEHGVELRLFSEVVGLDRASRTLRLADGTELDYGQLILATGSRPQPLPVPGGDHPELILVRDLASGERLRALAAEPQRVLVLGSGFIGCETAASLAARGADVVMITSDQLPHENRLGSDAGDRIGAWLRQAGVELRLGSAVTAIERDGRAWRVLLENGDTVVGDAVVCGGGARPNVELAEAAALPLEHGGVITDASLRTIDPLVFAVGDIAYAQNEAAGRHLRVEHWGDADTQGHIAGANAAGLHSTWDSAPGFWSTIGSHTLKYTSWGDGFDDYRFVGDDNAWSVWYRSGERLAGVLAVGDDDAYERGQQQLEKGARFIESG